MPKFLSNITLLSHACASVHLSISRQSYNTHAISVVLALVASVDGESQHCWFCWREIYFFQNQL